MNQLLIHKMDESENVMREKSHTQDYMPNDTFLLLLYFISISWTLRYFCLHSFLKGKSESHSVVSDSLWPHGLYSPWNSPGQNTGVGRNLPKPEIKLRSLALQADSLPTELWGKPLKQTVENSSGDGNNRPPYLHLEKSVCLSRSNS